MEAAGQGAHVDGAGELPFLVMSRAQQRRIQKVSLQPGHMEIRNAMVGLTVVGKASEATEVGRETAGGLPGEDDHNHTGQHPEIGIAEGVIEHSVP